MLYRDCRELTYLETCLIATIDQLRYIKIQPKTIDLSTRLWGITTEFVGVYFPEPRAEVYCVRLNFSISQSWSIRFSNFIDS